MIYLTRWSHVRHSLAMNLVHVFSEPVKQIKAKWQSKLILMLGNNTLRCTYDPLCTVSIWVIDQAWGQKAGCLQSVFFFRGGGVDGVRVEVHSYEIKRSWPISSHLDLTSLGHNGFIVWKRTVFSCGTQWVIPRGARQRHLDRSGSQSHGSNQFSLTAHRASQIIL